MSVNSLMPAPNSVLKGVKKYLQQAIRLDKVEPLVAYHCRMYAVTSAVAIKAGRTPDDLKLIGQLMTWLEGQKAMKAIPKDEAKTRCEAFALNVFMHADNEDRKGPATAPEWKQVALAFHAAYVFMDVCKQFGALDKEFAGRSLYAKWKTADIFKAINENRMPKPGSYSEQSGGGAGGADGGLEAELAELAREDGGAPAAPAPVAAAARPKPVASPPPAAAAPPAAASAPPPQVPSASVSKPPATAPAAASAPSGTAGGFSYPKPATAYPVYQPSSYAPLDDSASAPPANDMFMAPPQVPPPRVAVVHPSPSASSSSSASMAYGGGASSGGGGGGGFQLPKGALVVLPTPSNGDLGDAVHEVEKLLRHAQSALNFEDADTAVTKLKEALGLLLPHRKK